MTPREQLMNGLTAITESVLDLQMAQINESESEMRQAVNSHLEALAAMRDLIRENVA